MSHNQPPQSHYALMAVFGEAAKHPNYQGPLPEHFNALPWFRFDKPHRAEQACDLMRTARRLLLLQEPFELVGEAPKQLGKEGKTASIVVSSSADLLALHSGLADGFAQEYDGINFAYPEYNHSGYLAHVTPTSELPFAVGDRLLVDSIALVEGNAIEGERTPKRTIRVIGAVGLL